MTTYQTFSSEASRRLLQESQSEMLSCISAQIGSLRSRIEAACKRSCRDASEVRLVAVSKTVGLLEVAAALAVGVSDFAENRTALFVEKQAAYPEADWHFIGRIQTNKLKDIVGRATLIHSVASKRALTAIAARSERLGVRQEVLIEVNVSGEESKDGVTAKELPFLLELAASTEAVKVCGLMTMAPQAAPDVARAVFAQLRDVRDRFSGEFAKKSVGELSELSMGMSGDFELAIEEGATIVRIGRSVWQPEI